MLDTQTRILLAIARLANIDPITSQNELAALVAVEADCTEQQAHDVINELAGQTT